MRSYVLAMTLSVTTSGLARAQVRIPSVTVNPSLDTSSAVTGAIVRTLQRYWQLPIPGYTPTTLWRADEQGARGTYDWTAGYLYFQGASATILQVTPVDAAEEAFVVKTLFTINNPSGTSQQLGLQRLYASRSDSGWVLGGALPHLTREWRERRVGHIAYHFSSSSRFDAHAAAGAARFVDSLGAFLGIRPSPTIDYYMTSSTDEMYRIVGLDWYNQPSGPGTGHGGRAANADRAVFVGEPMGGEAYLHELAHVVMWPLAPPNGRQGLIEEGAATWFGGSRNAHLASCCPCCWPSSGLTPQ